MNISKSYYEAIANYNKPTVSSTWLGRFFEYILGSIQGFHYDKYWKRRNYVINVDNKNVIKKLYFLYWVKRVDARNHCSFGTSYNSGAVFLSPPILEHGPNGIIIAHDAKIGKNCRIFQQVTITKGGAVIGDNVIIGAGAKILPGVKIGNNAKIGANAVVVEDVPDNSTCVLQKPRIIIK